MNRISLLWITSLIAISLMLAILTIIHMIASSEITLNGNLLSLTFQQSLITFREGFQDLFPDWFRKCGWQIYISGLYIVLPVAFLLETKFPSNPRQAIFSRGLLQDAIWFVFNTIVLKLALFSIFASFLFNFYENHLSFLTIVASSNWPLVAKISIGFLIADFLHWVNHYLRHKFRILWSFHAVHHSQKELNVLTDDRNHPLDVIAGMTITFIPLLMFTVSVKETFFLALVMQVHSRLVHANIRTNLGPLGYLIVSPQFHRLHHSKEACDQDKNFGGFLSIWDYMFGTASTSNQAYPMTGIRDSSFPTEQSSATASGSVLTWLRQITYPAVQVLGKR